MKNKFIISENPNSHNEKFLCYFNENSALIYQTAGSSATTGVIRFDSYDDAVNLIKTMRDFFTKNEILCQKFFHKNKPAYWGVYKIR